ncbi:MAG: hypothetical protein WCP11_00070 [Candidatus Saccharibacteria bacterium]
MTQSNTLTEDQVKKLHQLENMALMLNKGCQAGELADANVEKVQANLNKIADVLIDENNSLGERSYIVYESQALLHWIAGDENEAYDFIKIAQDIKGDGLLFTKTARELMENSENNNTNSRKSVNTEEDDPGKTLGIVGLILAFTGVTLIGLILSILAYQKSKSADIKNELAIVGIWINSIFIIVGPLVFLLVFISLPALQRSQRDTARKNDASLVMTAVTAYSSNNKGALPQDSDITNGTFADNYLTNLDGTSYNIGVSSEQPSESKMIFTRGVNCPDAGSVTGNRQYNIQVKLESGEIYCTGS